MPKSKNPWESPMPEPQFRLMRNILAAPSPIGLEAAMTVGVLSPHLEKIQRKGWALHRFRGSASLVLDTHPDDDERFSVMVIGHADKIRMQVRSVGDDGKIWINSDSFLPLSLVGHEVILFSEDPDRPGSYRKLEGGTVEAVGAIHFADPAMRKGDKGIKPEQLYLELLLHGKDRKKQVEALGIRAGDTILMDRPIRRGFATDTFTGAYLDNGLGCFVTAEMARIVAEEGGLDNVRCLFTFATHEEIGRFGSRVLARQFQPDVVIGVDVNHDLDSAPGVGDKRFTPLKMGEGFTLAVGSVTSEYLNRLIEDAAREAGIPWQRDPCGRDTGTDAMAGVLASIDAATASIGFPIRNMHTISEAGHTGDVLAAIYALARTVQLMDRMNDGKGITADDLRSGHPRLDLCETLTAVAPDSSSDA
jgi:putative aminopeptidase FrvX